MDVERTQTQVVGLGESDGLRSELDLKHLWGVLRQRLWVVISSFVIVVTLGTVHAFKATPIYEASARIQLERPRGGALTFEDAGHLQSQDREYDRTQQEVLKSRVVLEKAVQDDQGVRSALESVGGEGASGLIALLSEAKRTVLAVMGTEPAAPSKPWESLREMVNVRQLRATHVLVVSVENPDPQTAATLANGVARAFERYHFERTKTTKSQTFDFLVKQREEQAEKIDDAENALQEFREQVNAVSLDEADKDNPVLVRLAGLNRERIDAKLRRIQFQAQFEVAQHALEDGTTDTQAADEFLLSLTDARSDPATTDLREKLLEAEKAAAALGDLYGSDHPQSKAARAKVDLLRGKLREAVPQIVGALAAQVEMLENQEEQLEEEYASQKEEALQLRRDAQRYSRLQKDVARQEKLFDALVEQLGKADLSRNYDETAERTNVEIIEWAEVPTQPVRPRKAQILALALVAGLLFGVGLALFFEHLDDTIKTPEDLERVGVPILGFVPDMHVDAGDVEEFAYRAKISVLDGRSPITEAYRSIRTSLFFSAAADQTKAVVITSGDAGDGKTTTASNLALIIAQSGKRVLLIDADMRKPMLHKIFELEPEVGLSNVLVGQNSLDDALRTVTLGDEDSVRIDVLFAGPKKPPNPAELLDSDRMRQLLSEVRQRYDRIIVDTPPVLIVADAAILSSLGDGVILVVKSEKNARSLAERARALLADVKARLLGGIVNDVQESVLHYHYSGYYYHGYSRYYDDYYGSGRAGAAKEA